MQVKDVYEAESPEVVQGIDGAYELLGFDYA